MNQSDHRSSKDWPDLSEEEMHQRTIAALADVDAGRTISHEEFMSWAKSFLMTAQGLQGDKGGSSDSQPVR